MGKKSISDAGPRLKAMNDTLEEIERLRLTHAEREAVEMFGQTAWTSLPWSEVEHHAAALRGLLDRTDTAEK